MMKFYSDLTDKAYDTKAEFFKAEEEYKKQQEAEKKKVDEKKARAKEVEDAYKAWLETNKKANTMVQEAKNHYLDLRDKFASDYGSYHMTYSNNGVEEKCTVDDWFDDIFKLLLK